MNTLVEHANKIIGDNPDKVQQARKNPQLAGWFVGQVMKATGGGYSEDDVRIILARRGIAGPRS